MYIGYFWCLSRLNELTEEYTQGYTGFGIKMDNIHKTRSASSKKEKNHSLVSMMDSFEDQLKDTTKYSLKHLEVNLLHDKIAQLQTSLLLKRENMRVTNGLCICESIFFNMHTNV